MVSVSSSSTPILVLGAVLLLASVVVLSIASSASSSGGTRRLHSHASPRILDPKSIVSKPNPNSVDDNNNDDNDNNNNLQLKYLFLGTSRTFGAQLDPELRTQQAFSYLLSANATNLGIPSGQSPYAAKCIYTMLHDSNVHAEHETAFDVIVLEYGGETKATLTLARRLRQRFPKAKIILLNMWLLWHFRNAATNQNLKQFAESSIGGDTNTNTNNVPYCEQVRDAVNKAQAAQDPKHENWRYSGVGYPQADVDEAASFGVEVFKVPVPDIYGAVNNHACSFFSDMHHYNANGHKFVADQLRQYLIDTKMRTHHDNTLGTWDAKDRCESWFRTGRTSIRTSHNIRMNEFVRGKFALEVTPNVYGPVWIKVWNADPLPQYLYLNCMVAAPDLKYPLMQVSISNNPPVISTIPDLSSSPWQVNLESELFVGKIPPGETNVMLKPLEEGKEWPFRIVGIVISNFSPSP